MDCLRAAEGIQSDNALVPPSLCYIALSAWRNPLLGPSCVSTMLLKAREGNPVNQPLV